MTDFIGYIGGSAIHDGVISDYVARDGAVTVGIAAQDGKRLVVEFSGVRSVRATDVIGMRLYALSEFSCDRAGERRFVFANWDAPDVSEAELEVLAESFSCDRV